MPNFFIVGASKSGTSSLYYYLKQHPKIFMTVPKEPYFFELEGEKCDFRGPGDEKRREGYITNIKEYLKLFRNVSDEIAIGEASTTYLDSPKAPIRIHKYIPDAKIIIILRNPADRAYASFLHLRREGDEKIENFLQVLKKESERISQNWDYIWHYKSRQFTYNKLKRYFEIFNKNKIKIYLYEEWKNDNLKVLRDVFKFLGVEDNFIPDLSVKYNVGGIPRNIILNNFLLTSNKMKTILKPLFPKKIRKTIQNKMINLNLIRTNLKPEFRRKLIDIFRDDIIKVQVLIGRDLSSWLL